MLSDLQHRLRALVRRGSVEAELDEELRSHVELQIEKAMQSGAPREEAERRARLEFGGFDQVKEECRDARGVSPVETTVRDLRYGIRALRKDPGFTAVTLFTLALAIGACTAVFSVVNGVLLRPLPYGEPEGLVHLWEDPSGKGQDTNSVAGAQFGDWKQLAHSFESLSAVRRVNLNLTGDDRPERLIVHKVSASYLGILRLSPLLGRGFLPDEDQAGREHVVVLTHALWQRHFGGSADVVGRSIRLGGENYSVIGVLPATPELPLECEALVPFVLGSEDWHRSRRDHRLRVIGRLRPGVTIEMARADMAAVTRRIKPMYPSWKQDWGVSVVPMHEQITGAIRRQLWVLFGAVGLVLLIACANVAGLLLARTSARQREMTLRAALGAGRWRVVRQLLTESVLLALLGGTLGVLVAVWCVRLFVRLGADSVPRLRETAVDPAALGFALLVTLVTGVLFGLAPSWHLARANLAEALDQGHRMTRARAGSRLRGGLVVLEVALALMLLAGTGLLLQTLSRLNRVPAGFDPRGVLAMDLSLDEHTHPAGDRRAVFLREIVRRVESLPGVQAAGTATTLPMAGFTDNTVRAENRPDEDRYYISADYDFVAGRFFRAMGVTLLSGRVFTEADDSATAPRVAILNQALADMVFPNEDPLGQRIRSNGQSWEVVGIVGNVQHRGLDRNAPGHVYFPQAFSALPCSLVVRTVLPPLAVADAVRGEISRLDSDQPVSNVRTLEQVVAKASGQRRLMLVVLGCFATTAVLLAAIGLYGLMAYSVSQRTREIGIRMALGARRGAVLGQIMRQGIGLSVAGVALGLAGAAALTRVLASLLFGVTPRDPSTFAAVAVLLVAVAVLACWLPAHRATRISPVDALRCE